MNNRMFSPIFLATFFPFVLVVLEDEILKAFRIHNLRCDSASTPSISVAFTWQAFVHKCSGIVQIGRASPCRCTEAKAESGVTNTKQLRKRASMKRIREGASILVFTDAA